MHRSNETHLDRAEFTSRLQSQDSESLGNYHLLLSVVRRRHTLEQLETFKSGGTSGGLKKWHKNNKSISAPVRLSAQSTIDVMAYLVGNHTTDRLVEDTGRSTVMERTGLLRVDQMALVEELVVSEL